MCIFYLLHLLFLRIAAVTAVCKNT